MHNYSKILVTGGAGFIGSQLVERLVHKGYFVRVLDNLSTGKLANIYQKLLQDGLMYFVFSDIRNTTVFENGLEGVDGVFHLAAQKRANTSPLARMVIRDPEVIEMIRVGHRGARAYAPENTLASFRKALEIGVDAVELDLRKTKDNQLVIMHDADVKRTTNGVGLVSDLTLAEIKSFSAGEAEKVPTLCEALGFLYGKAKVLIELKETGYEEQVLAEVQKQGMAKSVIFISFYEEALRKIRELNSTIQTGLIYSKHSNPLKAALDLKANYILPLYRYTHTVNVEKAHENGLKVIVWTINLPEEAVEYAKKGVDGITSDKPDILLGI